MGPVTPKSFSFCRNTWAGVGNTWLFYDLLGVNVNLRVWVCPPSILPPKHTHTHPYSKIFGLKNDDFYRDEKCMQHCFLQKRQYLRIKWMSKCLEIWYERNKYKLRIISKLSYISKSFLDHLCFSRLRNFLCGFSAGVSPSLGTSHCNLSFFFYRSRKNIPQDMHETQGPVLQVGHFLRLKVTNRSRTLAQIGTFVNF